jgi:hypothetical protein
VGLALPIDGSRDNEIKIKDLLGIQVGNWQDWTPTDGKEQLSNKGIIQTSDQLLVSWIDTVTSNRTLDEVEDQAQHQDKDHQVYEAVADEYI